MIEENKDIVSQNIAEHKTGYLVNRYDYKFVTFIRVNSIEIIQSLELHADFENPFVWYNSNGEIVLRYERIANPIREIIQ